MVVGRSRFGIPDVDLPGTDGGTVNPANFAGHEVVVLFCPADREAAGRDVADYVVHAKDFCDGDAWILGICEEGDPPCTHPGASLTMARDERCLAWDAFQDILEPGQRTPRAEGAVFLFDRGGGLRQSWAGTRHAAEVARAVRERR